jgi:tungstate transport system ATP-binding protein
MTMRAPLSDLPIVLEDAAVVVGQLTILNDIALTLAPGAPTVLVGPNGSGKTTLLRLAMGLLAPSRGRVTWGGRIDAASTRRGIVFQRPIMLRRSAEGNIRYALGAAGLARSERAARALAKEPQVLFLDEPTASLDPAASKAVEDVIRAVTVRGIKVVMATHDLGSARRLAGEVVLLHRGRIVETADAATFFANPATHEARSFVAGELLI